jgi:hypothetical protein
MEAAPRFQMVRINLSLVFNSRSVAPPSLQDLSIVFSDSPSIVTLLCSITLSAASAYIKGFQIVVWPIASARRAVAPLNITLAPPFSSPFDQLTAVIDTPRTLGFGFPIADLQPSSRFADISSSFLLDIA